MDSITAYCFLNCTNSANCCVPCGECATCCEKCSNKDTSQCSDLAYSDGVAFYKNYEYHYGSVVNANWSNNTTSRQRITNLGYVYNSKSGCTASGSSMSHTSDEDADEHKEKYFCNGDYCFGGACDNNDDCWTGGDFEYCTSSYGSCVGNFDPTCPSAGNGEDTCPTFNSGCEGLQCVCDTEDPEEGCDGTYESHNNATIYFEDEVVLYNSQGQLVNPSFLNATYDPCNPIATWGAACHFWAPP